MFNERIIALKNISKADLQNYYNPFRIVNQKSYKNISFKKYKLIIEKQKLSKPQFVFLGKLFFIDIYTICICIIIWIIRIILLKYIYIFKYI